jgi:hypothetical protein
MSVSINITRSVDIEDEVRNALKSYMTVYCRPLPADFTTPSVLITLVGGSDANQIDTFDVTLDARAADEATANETLRNAIGLMRKAAKEQTTAIRHIEVNSSGSWGSDPVRPDLSMYSARIRVVAHLENKTITV